MDAAANFKEKLKEVNEELSVDYVFPNLKSDVVDVDKVTEGDSKSPTFQFPGRFSCSGVCNQHESYKSRKDHEGPQV